MDNEIKKFIKEMQLEEFLKECLSPDWVNAEEAMSHIANKSSDEKVIGELTELDKLLILLEKRSINKPYLSDIFLGLLLLHARMKFKNEVSSDTIIQFRKEGVCIKESSF